MLCWLSACGQSQLNCLHLSCFEGELPLPALRCLHDYGCPSCPWVSWLLCLRSGRKRRLVNSVRPAVSPEKIRGWSRENPFPVNSWYRVHSVGHSPGYLCCLAPLPLFPSMLPPPCHCQGAKNFLRGGNMEGRRKPSGISPVSSCASFPPRCVPHFSKRIRFLVKCLSSAVGVQQFGMLLNAAKPLALEWGLVWAETVPVVSSQVGMTGSPLVTSVAGWVTLLGFGLKWHHLDSELASARSVLAGWKSWWCQRGLKSFC